MPAPREQLEKQPRENWRSWKYFALPVEEEEEPTANSTE
jgi:hypothetical protein